VDVLKNGSLALFGNAAREKQGSSEMCFSAGAPFGASAISSAIAVACFAKAATPAQNMWAGIPLFFFIRQAI